MSRNSRTKKTQAPARPRRLEVRGSGIHGRGVFATRTIRKGSRIIEYTGKRMSWDETPSDSTDPHTFLFLLDNGEVINPEIGGNDARWINHSCEPNCEALEEDDGRIFIYALRTLRPGEELSYDYAMEIDEPRTKALEKAHACLCRSPNCRGTLLAAL